MEELNHEIIIFILERLKEFYDPSQWGDCNEINSTANYCLYNLGFQNGQCVSGFVNLNIPMSNFEDDYNESDVFDPLHFWIVINNRILDLASEQFNDHLLDFKGSPYFYGNNENYVQTEEHELLNEFVNKRLGDRIVKEYKFSKMQ